MRSYLSLGLISLLLSACASYEDDIPAFERPQAQNAAEIAFAKATLDALQIISIKENREYCGYIGLTLNGEFQATPPRRGRKGSCQTKDIPEGFRVLASYHTHGSFSVKFDSELPSSDDLLADIEEGVDGYIGTPGGRVWFTDARAKKTVKLCAEGCISADPNYDPSDAPNIEAEYSLKDLIAFDS